LQPVRLVQVILLPCDVASLVRADVRRRDRAAVRSMIGAALRRLKPGDAIVYHAGHLAADRRADRLVDWVAEAFATLAARHGVALTQRRLARGSVEYLAFRRPVTLP
jgi:NAD(P)-dependent dehydrogenase (short-subunit alcohol dehydrogenase family)